MDDYSKDLVYCTKSFFILGDKTFPLESIIDIEITERLTSKIYDKNAKSPALTLTFVDGRKTHILARFEQLQKIGYMIIEAL
jgi:hypothetical protein